MPFPAAIPSAADSVTAFHVFFPLLLFGVGLWLGWLMFRRAHKLLMRAKRREEELLQDAKALRSQVVALRMAAEGKAPRLPPLFKAHNGEDLVLFELFNPPGSPLKTSGLAIECGAHDGETGSLTYILDAMGWDCVLVEPLPHLAARCRASRPRAKVVESALSKRGSSGTVRIEVVEGNEGSSYLSSEGHAGRGSRKKSRTLEVPLSTMDGALGDELRQVDVLVLDVEGSELNVLDGFDLGRFRPRVMVIEDHELGEGGGLVEYLSPRGYAHAGWVWRNRIFIRADDAALMARAAELLQTRMGLKRTPG